MRGIKMKKETANELMGIMTNVHDEEYVGADIRDIDSFEKWVLNNSNISSDELDRKVIELITSLVG